AELFQEFAAGAGMVQHDTSGGVVLFLVGFSPHIPVAFGLGFINRLVKKNVCGQWLSRRDGVRMTCWASRGPWDGLALPELGRGHHWPARQCGASQRSKFEETFLCALAYIKQHREACP